MSNRLDSLNLKKSGSKPALKFKPKVVARKSKEDREKNSPVVKTEEKASQPSTRGRGGLRGRGRGRGGSYAGTHVVSAGPLASSAVGSGPVATSKTGLTNDKIFGAEGKEQADPLLNLKMKSRSQSDGTPAGEDSDDDSGVTKINMSRDYQFDATETVLFPVRPQKDAEKEASKVAMSLSSTTSATSSRAPSRTPGPELVKSESSEDIKREHTPDLVLDRVGGTVEQDEHNRLIDDQRAIVDLVTGKFAGLKADNSNTIQQDNYFLVHLPQISNINADEDATKEKSEETFSELANLRLANFLGHIGQLNFHRSGKITMSLGSKTTLNVAQGVPSSFLQELYVIDSQAPRASGENDSDDILDEEGRKDVGDIYRLGEVTAKLVATPEIR